MNNRRALLIALFVTLLVFLVELAGSYLSGSLALFSDAGHMLTDALALSLAILAAYFSALPADKARTFGFYRLEILSALFNGTLLTLIAIYIFYQAAARFAAPVKIETGMMLAVAVIGLIANLAAALFLARSSGNNLNTRGAFLHVLSDAASSVGVIIAALLILLTGWYFLDPLISIFIGLLILYGALNLVSASVNILLEGAPEGIVVAEVAREIKKVPGVKELHDLHVWAISSGINAASAHILIADGETERAAQVLTEIERRLKHFNITHTTFQTECENCQAEEGHGHRH